MSGKCLIVDRLHESIHTLLEQRGIYFDYKPDITREEIKNILSAYDGLIIRTKTRVDADLLKGSKLKYIARAGAGIDNIDEAFINAQGIAIMNAPEGNRDSVGEHTIGLILSLLHNLHKGNDEVRDGIWAREENRGNELSKMTVGLVGLGNSGLAVAKKLGGFGCKVIAYDKYLDASSYPNYLVDESRFFSEVDILSLHIPLTPETDSLLTTEYLNRFSKPLYFINVSRGEIANFATLRTALGSGKIIKAALDVLECEDFSKLSRSQKNDLEWLKKSGKVIFTPHVAGWTYESYERINAVLVEKMVLFLDIQH